MLGQGAGCVQKHLLADKFKLVIKCDYSLVVKLFNKPSKCSLSKYFPCFITALISFVLLMSSRGFALRMTKSAQLFIAILPNSLSKLK